MQEDRQPSGPSDIKKSNEVIEGIEREEGIIEDREAFSELTQNFTVFRRKQGDRVKSHWKAIKKTGTNKSE